MTRIQRKRTKGWKSPEGTVYVGRPSQWGNFYRGGLPDSNVERYREWLLDTERQCPNWLREHVAPLMKARHLSCWCPLDQPCHADVWIEFCTRLRAAASDGGEENEG